MKAIIVEGIVRAGRKLGGKLGFPTANIAANGLEDVPDGVYAARIEAQGGSYDGMANLGFRPSVEPLSRERLLEVNLFGFEGTLYGEHICVELVWFVRPEVRFGSLEELKEAVDNDRRIIGEYFAQHR